MKVFKKLLIMLLLIGIVILFFGIFHDEIKISINDVYIKLYGEPISEDGIINNKFFNINKYGKSAKNTTEGINKAIKYANENNITYIKLDKGTYLINGVDKYYKEKGITLKSNIILDLNGSTIKHEPVSDERYSIITIFETENIEIKNGIIDGDKNEHDYSTVEFSHEFGYGIELRGAKNIKLSNLMIKNLTGDGILISEMEKAFSKINEDNISQKIHIYNCDISENRRQGISIIDAKDVYVYNNEIHDIKGTNPQCGIDLEPNLKTEEVDNIYIYNNKFYELEGAYAIKTEGGTLRAEIYDNDMTDCGMLIASAEENINIYNNFINNGKIEINLTDYNANRGYRLNSVQMEGNNISKTNVYIKKVNQLLVNNNRIDQSNVQIKDSDNILILNNIMENNNNHLFKYEIGTSLDKIYNLYLYNNTNIEDYNIEINNTDRVNIVENIEEINNYINNNF